MLKFKNIEITDKEEVQRYTYGNPYDNCDFSFVNMYMWRKKYLTKFAVEDGFLVTLSSNKVFLMPVGSGDLKGILQKMIDYSKEKNFPFVLGAVTPLMREHLEEAMPGAFEFAEDRDNSDYLYLRERLTNLTGKKLHSKRNHINKFKLNNEYTFETITKENIEDVIKMQGEWCHLNDCVEDEELWMESCSVRDVLKNFFELDVKGGLIRVGERVVAFSIGQALSDRVFDVCIEKAFSDVTGAYAIMNNEFAKNICEGYELMNREEDLGIEGLRKAKLSYYPEIILDKGSATLR